MVSMKYDKTILSHAGMLNLYGTVAAMLLFVAATCLFSACQSDGEDSLPPVEPDANYAVSRTLMVYMVAENNLSSKVGADFMEMQRAMKDQALQDGDRMVVYVDDVQLPRIYVLTKDTMATQLVETYAEDVNSSSADELKKFVMRVKQEYPAESYGLVLWSHASGWQPSNYIGGHTGVSAPRRSFGLDNSANLSSSSLNGHQMEIPDMAAALEACGGVDFIFFDACFMQTAEVAYALRGATKHVVASPAEIPGPGADYATMTKAMFRKDDYVEQMLQSYYATYPDTSTYGIVISAVETAAMDNFAAYMSGLVSAHRQELLDVNVAALLNYSRFMYWTTSYPDFVDMQSLMKQVLTAAEFAEWQIEVGKVVKCLHTNAWYSALPNRKIAIPEGECSGLTMFVPRTAYNGYSSNFNAKFLQTAWAQKVWEGQTGLETDEGVGR